MSLQVEMSARQLNDKNLTQMRTVSHLKKNFLMIIDILVKHAESIQ